MIISRSICDLKLLTDESTLDHVHLMVSLLRLNVADRIRSEFSILLVFRWLDLPIVRMIQWTWLDNWALIIGVYIFDMYLRNFWLWVLLNRAYCFCNLVRLALMLIRARVCPLTWFDFYDEWKVLFFPFEAILVRYLLKEKFCFVSEWVVNWHACCVSVT